MKKYSFVFILLLIIASWGFAFFSFTKFYTPTIIIPFLDNFYWAPTHIAIFGLTAILTIITLTAFFIIKRYKSTLKKWYLLNGAGYLIWTVVILSQLKITAFNLGICH